MADAQNVLMDWLDTDRAKSEFYATNQATVIRWFSEANNRYCDKSEVIRDVWKPIIDSTGIVPLPDDWLREVKDRVKWDTSRFLIGINHADALVRQFIGTYYYSIWGHNFYVWQAAAGTPQIPYIRRPDDITTTNIGSYVLDLHREDQHNLFGYLDSCWARHTGDLAGSIALLRAFDQQADIDGQDIRDKYQPAPMVRGSWF